VTAATWAPIGCAISIGDAGDLITGHIFANVLKPPLPGKEDPVLEVRRVSCEGQYANVNLELRPGEILGLIGRLDADRTELALSLFGMNPPDGRKYGDEGIQCAVHFSHFGCQPSAGD
jgi:ABC-type sugar transport system ATPase subunit